MQTEVVIPGAPGDSSSIIGTTVLQPHPHPHPQQRDAQRKGILKHTANTAAVECKNWDYQLSPEDKAGSKPDHEPDILHLPIGLPPPPQPSNSGTTATVISGPDSLILISIKYE